MGKNFSAPLERTARLLDLVPYINTHQGIALKDLAAVFEVSHAQMVNDLTTLWMCGLPGYTPLELMDLDFESGYVNISNAPTLAKPRTWIRKTPAGRLFWRVLIGVIGGGVTVFGAVLLVAPGPGVLVLLAGLDRNLSRAAPT